MSSAWPSSRPPTPGVSTSVKPAQQVDRQPDLDAGDALGVAGVAGLGRPVGKVARPRCRSARRPAIVTRAYSSGAKRNTMCTQVATSTSTGDRPGRPSRRVDEAALAALGLADHDDGRLVGVAAGRRAARGRPPAQDGRTSAATAAVLCTHPLAAASAESAGLSGADGALAADIGFPLCRAGGRAEPRSAGTGSGIRISIHTPHRYTAHPLWLEIPLTPARAAPQSDRQPRERPGESDSRSTRWTTSPTGRLRRSDPPGRLLPAPDAVRGLRRDVRRRRDRPGDRPRRQRGRHHRARRADVRARPTPTRSPASRCSSTHPGAGTDFHDTPALLGRLRRGEHVHRRLDRPSGGEPDRDGRARERSSPRATR